MKKIIVTVLIGILFIFFVLILCAKLGQAQEIKYNTNGSVDLHFGTVGDWEKYRDKIVEKWIDEKVKDSLINAVYLPAIQVAKEQRRQCDSSVMYLKKRLESTEMQVDIMQNAMLESSMPKEEGLIEFARFYTGIKTGYIFGDNEINKELFFNSISNNIYINAQFLLSMKKFLIKTILDVPLTRQNKTGLWFGVSYKIY